MVSTLIKEKRMNRRERRNTRKEKNSLSFLFLLALVILFLSLSISSYHPFRLNTYISKGVMSKQDESSTVSWNELVLFDKAEEEDRT